MCVNLFFHSFNEVHSVRLLENALKMIRVIFHSTQNEIADAVDGVINNHTNFFLSVKHLIKEGFWFWEFGYIWGY